MQRFHVNVSVENIDKSVEFYNALFATEPTVRKDDYAKWMLDDPRVNFAITTHGNGQGIDHVGIQAETDEEFKQMRERLEAAQNPLLVQDDTQCCYANSSKTWVRDPQGVPWETFITHGESTDYGDGGEANDIARFESKTSESATACCDVEEAKPSSACCTPG